MHQQDKLLSFLLSIIEPLIFGVLFFILELVKSIKSCTASFEEIMYLAITCPASVIIPTVLIFIVQQYIVDRFAEKKKLNGILLVFLFVVYSFAYGFYYGLFLRWIEPTANGNTGIVQYPYVLGFISFVLTIAVGFFLYSSVKDIINSLNNKVHMEASNKFNGTNEP